MAGTYAKYSGLGGTGGGGGGSGITSINGDTTPNQTITGTSGVVVSTISGVTTISPGLIDPTSPSTLFQTFDDFTAYNYQPNNQYPVGQLELSFTGTVARLDNTYNNRVGIVQFSAGSGSEFNGYFSDIQDILFGAGTYTLEGSFYIPALPTITNSYGINFGFADSFPTESNGVNLKCNYLMANWQAETYSNGTGTLGQDTGIPVATGWHTLRIEVNSTATLASYYIDGVLGTTISTNIPTTSAVGVVMDYQWYAGTLQPLLQDYIQFSYQFTSSRGAP